jgi:hypothetical protein
MASQIGWQSLVAAGAVSDRDVRRWIRRDGAFDPSMRPLRNYETRGGRTPQYARWHLAIRHLLGSAQPGALVRFCARVGQGRPWRAAFMESFGTPVFGFYARFEAAARTMDDGSLASRGG